MATLASSKIRISTLLAVARGDFYMNNMGGKTTISAIEWLQANGYVDFKTTPRDGYLYFVTAKGIEVLDIHAPMVDQPQLPADVQTIDGEVSFMAPDGKIYDGTIKAGADRYGYTIRAVDGTVYDEIKRSDIEPRLADEIDDLPFSQPPSEVDPIDALVVTVERDYQFVEDTTIDDGFSMEALIQSRKADDAILEAKYDYDDLPFTDIGTVDPDDTQELPIVVDAPAMSLSQLVDAALDPDNQDAYTKLQAMDFSQVSLAEIEFNRDDVARYKWDLLYDLGKMKFGFFSNNAEYWKQMKEAERAFEVDKILSCAMDKVVR